MAGAIPLLSALLKHSKSERPVTSAHPTSARATHPATPLFDCPPPRGRRRHSSSRPVPRASCLVSRPSPSLRVELELRSARARRADGRRVGCAGRQRARAALRRAAGREARKGAGRRRAAETPGRGGSARSLSCDAPSRPRRLPSPTRGEPLEVFLQARAEACHRRHRSRSLFGTCEQGGSTGSENASSASPHAVPDLPRTRRAFPHTPRHHPSSLVRAGSSRHRST